MNHPTRISSGSGCVNSDIWIRVITLVNYWRQCNTIFLVCGITIIAITSVYIIIAIICSVAHGPIETVEVETGNYTETYGEPYYENGTKKCNVTMTPETTRQLEDSFWMNLMCFSSLFYCLIAGVAIVVMVLSLDNICPSVRPVSKPRRRAGLGTKDRRGAIK